MARKLDHDTPVVSITSVLFNSASTVDRYAAPLKDLVASGFATVTVVDNASPDDSAARLKSALPEAKVITAGRNLGFARGCNLAWASVEGRYWLLLNPDVEASAEGVRELVRWMDAHPDVAVATPMLDDDAGTPAGVARAFPTIRWTFAELLRVHKLMGPDERSRRLMGPYWNGRPGAADWVPFASVVIRREAIEEVGVLSDKLFMYGEDVELCWRLQQAGWRVAIIGGVTFKHTGGASATATWNEEERGARLVAGIAGALRLIHGHLWTRVYAAAKGLSLFVESLDSRRAAPQRRSSRVAALAWFRQAGRRQATDAPSR